MKRTRKKPPYLPNGKTNFPHKGPGVYMIFPIGSERPKYIGMGGIVYKALYRHFQSWEDPKQVRITYPKGGYLVRVIYTRTRLQAERLERALVLKYKPADNPTKFEQYSLTPALEALAEAAEESPFINMGDAPF